MHDWNPLTCTCTASTVLGIHFVWSSQSILGDIQLLCMCVFSSAGERVEGNLEGYGIVEFNDGHTYEVRRLLS